MKLVVETLLDNDHSDEDVVRALEQRVDEEIAEFDEYFQKELGNDPLVKGESAIIKTFLHYHLVHKKKDA